MSVILITKQGKPASDPKNATYSFDAQVKVATDRIEANGGYAILHVHGGMTSLEDGKGDARDIRRHVYQDVEPPNAAFETMFLLWQSSFADSLRRTLETKVSNLFFDNLMLTHILVIRNGLKALENAYHFSLGETVASDGAIEWSPRVAGTMLQGDALRDAFQRDAIDFLVHDNDFKIYVSMLAKSVAGDAVGAPVNAFPEDAQVRASLAELSRKKLGDLGAVARASVADRTDLSDPKAKAAAMAAASASVKAFWTGIVAEIMWRVAERIAIRRDHGYTTVVEELLRVLYLDMIAKDAWSGMKGIARDHFTELGGAGLRILEELAKTNPKKLIVVGHSAGALFALPVVEAARRILPQTCSIDVVLLAAAVRMDEAARFMSAFKPNDNNRLLVVNMSDDHERHDKLDAMPPGKIYQRSMLYFVSGIAEDRETCSDADAAVLGMHRFLDDAVLSESYLDEVEKLSRSLVKAALDEDKDRFMIAPNVKHHTGFEHPWKDSTTLEVAEHLKSFIKASPAAHTFAEVQEGGIDIGNG